MTMSRIPRVYALLEQGDARGRSPPSSAGWWLVIVELGELLLELADALVGLLVAADVPQERRVVVRADHAALAAPVAAALAAHQEPQDRADDQQKEHDDDPERLVERAHPSLLDERDVHDGEHVERKRHERDDHEQPCHGVHSTFPRDSPSGRELGLRE